MEEILQDKSKWMEKATADIKLEEKKIMRKPKGKGDGNEK